MVWIRADAIYVFEGLVDAVQDKLTQATGIDMRGKVILSVNHSHSAPANFDMGLTWYLGGDKFNSEVFQRAVESMFEVSLSAWKNRQPAAIGIGQKTNWDPNDRVYRDRRDENDSTVFFEDIPAGRYKDPYLTVLRVDTASGDPIGLFFAFGMHGTVMGEANQLWSAEASGHVEISVEERFDKPVVVGFVQHGGGDASPAGIDRGFASMESIGEFAADTIYDLWKNTPTASEPIHLETVTRTLDTHRDLIRVHRDYGVLEYAPYNPVKGYQPDNIIYDDQGRIRTPIDEFNTEYGGAFCGTETPQIPLPTIGASVFPYTSCNEVSTMAGAFGLFFGLTQVELPLPESVSAKITATRMGPLPILTASGETVTDDVLFGFFPGEATATYTEQFRRRAAAELGMNHAIPIGYSQDHQGYLLIPEDWLTGGYEPNINIWGPLQGEYIMEGLLDTAKEVLTTETIEPFDPSKNSRPVYPVSMELPANEPDLTPNAGTPLTEAPGYLYTPLTGAPLEIAPPARVRRIQDVVQFVWEGGDPGVDLPVVYLERQSPAGEWVQVHTGSGRAVNSAMHDILLTTTPNPLQPFTADQTHTWWLGWQTVPHGGERQGLPTGQYRFHVYGKRYSGGAKTWPWPTEPYELTSDAFEVAPAEIALQWDDSGLVTGSIDAPAWGYRFIDPEGNSRGHNPVHKATLVAKLSNGSTEELNPEKTQIRNNSTQWILSEADRAIVANATEIQVVDADGNSGTLSLP